MCDECKYHLENDHVLIELGKEPPLNEQGNCSLPVREVLKNYATGRKIILPGGCHSGIQSLGLAFIEKEAFELLKQQWEEAKAAYESEHGERIADADEPGKSAD